MAHTYATTLDQSGARTLWAINTLYTYKSYGTDVTSTFAEAPDPKALIYVTIDTPFKA